MATSAANMLPPEYDDVHPNSYDPAYTADISTKMRVPHKLDVVEQGEEQVTPSAEEERHRNIERAAAMHIPDKIVLAEGDRAGIDMHGPGIRPLPAFHLDLDPSSISSQNYISLQTPPRVLTLEENAFPDVREERNPPEVPKSRKSHVLSSQNGYIPISPPHILQSDSLEHEASLTTPGQGLLIEDEDDDELAVLRRQIAKLSRHVIRIEEENAKRSQRELFFYPLVMGYLLFQMARWFLRRD